MRRANLLLLLLPLLLAPLACGDDDETPVAGADGAFGGADDCSQLVDETIEARQEVLADLGDARRRDTERIDAALTSFGEGPDLAVRYEGLGCDQGFEEAVCAAAGELQAGGPAGRDLLATWTASCEG